MDPVSDSRSRQEARSVDGNTLLSERFRVPKYQIDCCFIYYFYNIDQNHSRALRVTQQKVAEQPNIISVFISCLGILNAIGETRDLVGRRRATTTSPRTRNEPSGTLTTMSTLEK